MINMNKALFAPEKCNIGAIWQSILDLSLITVNLF